MDAIFPSSPKKTLKYQLTLKSTPSESTADDPMESVELTVSDIQHKKSRIEDSISNTMNTRFSLETEKSSVQGFPMGQYQLNTQKRYAYPNQIARTRHTGHSTLQHGFPMGQYKTKQQDYEMSTLKTVEDLISEGDRKLELLKAKSRTEKELHRTRGCFSFLKRNKIRRLESRLEYINSLQVENRTLVKS